MLSTRIAALSAVTLVAFAATIPASAAPLSTTITDNGASYTAGATDIAQLDFSGGIDPGKYSNNYESGQSFTTLSNALGYSLTSFTLKGGGSAGNNFGTFNFILDVGSVGADGKTLTPLAQFSASSAPIANSSSDFFTFNLAAANLHLDPGTQYAFGISDDTYVPGSNHDGPGYFGFTKGNGDVYSGGIDFTENDYYGSNVIMYPDGGSDKTFAVGLKATGAPVPEASSSLSLGLLLALGFGGFAIARKRKSASA